MIYGIDNYTGELKIPSNEVEQSLRQHNNLTPDNIYFALCKNHTEKYMLEYVKLLSYDSLMSIFNETVRYTYIENFIKFFNILKDELELRDKKNNYDFQVVKNKIELLTQVETKYLLV